VLTDFQNHRGPRLCIDADGTLMQILGLKRILHLANPSKISMLKWRDLCIHPKSPTKIFNHLKLRYLQETRLLYMKSINHHSKSKDSLAHSKPGGPTAKPSCIKPLRQSSRNWNAHCTLLIHQKVLCIHENIIASIQSPKPKYSMPPNLEILGKLDFWKWNQTLKIGDQKTLCAF
jgi:hypothetical protein